MDPNVTLAQIRELVSENEYRDLYADETDRLVELVQSLDQWISKGGFLPADWNKQ